MKKKYSKESYSIEEQQGLIDVYNCFPTIKDNEIIEGIVMNLTNREVHLNVGYKSDGIVLRSEFRYNPDLKIGDRVDLFVESRENSKGIMTVSHQKARFMVGWDKVIDAYTNQSVVKGHIKSRTNKGYIVDLYGIEAFLPGSQIESNPVYDDSFVDQIMEFKVIKINHEIKNVIVSHKIVIENDLKAQRAAFISKLKAGQIVEGTVKNITSYGVFVDLGGVDGLIYISDLCYKRINHPSDIVSLNQIIKVVVLKIENDKVSLSLKHLSK